MRKIVVTGSRDWTDGQAIINALKEMKNRFPGEELVLITGGARGADKLAYEIGKRHGFTTVILDANWSNQGRTAGPIRNRRMLDWFAPIDVVLAFPLPQGSGTRDCMAEALKRNIEVIVHNESP